jgi:hypothetical protein
MLAIWASVSALEIADGLWAEGQTAGLALAPGAGWADSPICTTGDVQPATMKVAASNVRLMTMSIPFLHCSY